MSRSVVRNRTGVIVALALVVLLVGAGGLLAYDSSQHDKIAKGIKASGIDIGGLSASQARARLRSQYLARLDQPIVAVFHQHRYLLRPRDARVAIDINGTVDEALKRSRDGNIFSRAFRSLTGGRVNAELDPQVTFARSAVQGFVGTITKELSHPAQDASISYSADSLSRVDGKPGLVVRAGALTNALQDALIHPNANHTVKVSAVATQPKVTTRQLAAQFPAIITIDRSNFRLRLWKHLQLAKSYPIAVGMAGLETPAGLYHINDKEVNPSWHVPNSAWAGSLAGQTIPPGPSDPIKARWMGIYNGAGIHGTDATGSLGSAASHGCIRMAIPDVIELYDQAPMGAPVYIA
jgi:lipoprotein-anchoring transpeptidase ErfK/SrfK